MKWLQLVWWVWLRGTLSGAIEGALLGTIAIPLVGTLMGAGFGLIIGAILGLVNGLSLALLTRVFFYRRRSRSRFIACVMLVAIPLNVIAVVTMLGNQLGNTTAVLVAITAAYYSFGYVDFVAAQFDPPQATASPEPKKGVIVW